MPPFDGCRLHEVGNLMPQVPNFGRHYPEQPEGRCELRLRLSSVCDPTLAHGQLAFRGQQSGRHPRPRPNQSPEKCPHIFGGLSDASNEPTKPAKKITNGAHPHTLGAWSCPIQDFRKSLCPKADEIFLPASLC